MSIFRSLLSCSALFAVAACAGPSAATFPTPGTSLQVPFVRQKGGGSSWVRFLPKTTATAPYTYNGMAIGPDHNVWFQDVQGNGVVRLTETGGVKEYTVLHTEGYSGIAVGADGRFYVGAYDSSTFQGYVDAMTQSGTTTAYPIGMASTTDNLSGGVAEGPDGNIWFVEYHHVAKITTSGTITQYPYPNSSYYANPGDIVRGSDGNMWLTLGGGGVNPAYLVKVDPTTGGMTSYDLTALVGCAFDNALAEGPDGNVWVDCGSSIVRVTPGGVATAFATPSNAAAGEVSGDITAGGGQTIWYGGAASSGKLVQYDIAAKAFHVFTPPAHLLTQPRITLMGPDGNEWFSAVDPSSNHMAIAVYVLAPLRVSPAQLTLSGPGATGTLTVSETGVTNFTAKSSNTGVASVAPSGSGSFIVTAVSAGTCDITVADQSQNSVLVKVTVN